jgi:hypothetical protein
MENTQTESIRLLNIHVPPLPKMEVEYFEEVSLPLTVINTSSEPILLESITLRFQSDADISKIYVQDNCSCIIKPQEMRDIEVKVIPTPMFLANTNVFDVMVTYRLNVDGKLSEQASYIFRAPQGCFIIIKPSTTQLGQIFISFKQPEDLKLAKILERFAERAGFKPYLAIHDSQPGTQLWDRIEPALRGSLAVLVLWTKHTQWGDGVQREVELCRAHGIQDILLIENGLDLPLAYKGTESEYRRFDYDDPFEPFSKVITIRRKLLLEI